MAIVAPIVLTSNETGANSLTDINNNFALVATMGTRVATVADAATITPTADTCDIYTVTALGQAATIAAPSGTPVNGQKLIIRILDNGTARGLTWNSIYAVIGCGLPTTTVLSKYTYVGCVYNSASTKWDVLAVA